MTKLLPQPTVDLTIPEIARFKADNAAALTRFRRAVEIKCIDIAQVEDALLREERAQLMAEELQEEIGGVAEAMRLRWGHIVMVNLSAVLGAAVAYAATPESQSVAKNAAGSALASAIYQMFDPLRMRQEALQKPMAYGALVRAFART